MTYKKFSDNYENICNAFGLTTFCDSTSEELYFEQLELDFKRTNFYSKTQFLKDIYALLRKKPAIPLNKWVYTQGGMDGRFLAEVIAKGNLYSASACNFNPEISSDFYKTASVGYLNDDGIPCGFALVYLKDHSNPDVPIDERPRYLSVVHIENILAAVSERRVTCIIHDKLLEAFKEIRPEMNAEGVLCEADQIETDVSELLKSEAISSLYKGVISGNTLNIDRFNKLHAYLSFPKTTFEDMLEVYKQNNPANSKVQNFIQNIFKQSTELDFYSREFSQVADDLYFNIRKVVRDKEAVKKNYYTWLAIKFNHFLSQTDFELQRDEISRMAALIQKAQDDAYFPENIRNTATHLLAQVGTAYENTYILKQSFIRRNYGCMALATVSVVLAVSVVIASVVLSAVLTPVYTSLLAAFAVILAACLAAAAFKMLLNHRNFKNANSHFIDTLQNNLVRIDSLMRPAVAEDGQASLPQNDVPSSPDHSGDENAAEPSPFI